MPWRFLCWTELRVTLSARQAGHLPAYKGSLLRGVLGHALQRRSCWHETVCQQGCGQPAACAFGDLWEEKQSPAGSALKGYVISPGPAGCEQTGFRPGDRLEFTLRLFGAQRVWGPWFLAALADLEGLGSARVPFQIERVTSPRLDGGSTDHFAHGQWSPSAFPVWDAPTFVAGWTVRSEAMVRFRTPVDLQTQQQRLAELEVETVLRRLSDRVDRLASEHCGAPEREAHPPREPWECPGEVDSGGLARWRRFSSTQKGHQPMRGSLGRIQLRQIPGRLWPYLVLGQVTHVGKGTTFGQGAYVLETAPPGTGNSATSEFHVVPFVAPGPEAFVEWPLGEGPAPEQSANSPPRP